MEIFCHYSIPAFDSVGGPILQNGAQIESGKFELRQPAVLVSKLNPRKLRVQISAPSDSMRSVASTEFMVYTNLRSDVDLRYLYHLLSSNKFARRLEAAAMGTTNSHIRVNPSETLGWPVWVPPLKEQQNIAEILDEIDEAIVTVERIKVKYDKIRIGLASDLLNSSRYSTQPGVSLGEITLLISRGSAPVYVAHSSVTAIGQRCGQNSGFVPSAGRPHNESVVPRMMAKAGDVLVNSTGTGTIGRSCLFTETCGIYMVDSHVTVVRSDPNQVDPRFLNEIMRVPHGQQFLHTHCFTGSTNQIELSQAELSRMPVRLPPLNEQRKIAGILEDLDGTIRSNQRQLEKVRQLRAGLAADLFSGKLQAVAM